MPKSKTLKDLYVVGKDVDITDDQGNTVSVYVKKLNPVDHETTVRKANARRARVLSMARVPKDSEERDVYMNQLFDIAPDRASMIEFLAGEHIGRCYASKEAELAADEQWSKDEYIQGLRDAWTGGLFQVYLAGAPEDEFEDDTEYKEAVRVKEELERFQEALSKELELERADFKSFLDDDNDEELIEAAINRIIESQADLEWLTEYKKCEVWLGVRDPKTKNRYFAERHMVDEIATPVLGQLIRAYAELNVDVVEGKD